MANEMITIKLNRFTSYLRQTTYQTQSPSPSPSDIITIIIFQLNQWLAAISNLFDTFFPPETRAEWLDFAGRHWVVVVLSVVLMVLTLCCCLPIIFSCITWVLVGIFNVIKGLFMMVINGVKSVFRCLCCCGRTSVKMMKAPGRGGRVYIPRAAFESNPSAYFQGLRTRSNKLF